MPGDERHLVVRSMLRGLGGARRRTTGGLRLVCRNTVPHGRGLGSSAAAIVAGVVAAQGLHAAATHGADHDVAGFDRPSPTTWPVPSRGTPTTPSASVSAGRRSPGTTTTAPAGCTRCSWTCTPTWSPVVLVPAEQLSTATARAVLPERIAARRRRPSTSGRSALLVEAASRRPDLLLPATREWLHQEHRRASCPHTMALVDRLRAHGLAAVVSGAGPSVLVLATPASDPGGARPGRHGGVARARTGNDLPRRERPTCDIEGAAGGDRRAGSCRHRIGCTDHHEDATFRCVRRTCAALVRSAPGQVPPDRTSAGPGICPDRMTRGKDPS